MEEDESGGGNGNQDEELMGETRVLEDKYEVGKLLGYGAFAKVYHGRNLNTGQSVAIKCVSKQKVVQGGLTSHIKREISIMSRLSHPHIIKLFEVLATKSKIYFVMEFAKGGELFAKVSKGRFSEDLSRRYFHQLISTVSYCHSRGVFHRDLKPENLLLDENWDLRVTDFGLSAVNEQIRPDGLLHTLCGTPAYVAPEILMKKGYDGAKVDVWSCGIILYVLNAGYLPFNDRNLMVMYRKIHKGEFRCPKWISPDLKRFLSRLLDSNPETRITVNEIIKDPWFTKGGGGGGGGGGYYKEFQNIYYDDFDDELKDCDDDDQKKEKSFLNAFDLISFSPGVDLTGLLNKPHFSVDGERFVSAESPEKIIGKIEEIATMEELGMTVIEKKDWGAKLQGQNGNSVIVFQIHRLTEKLVVVEIRRRGNDMGPSQEEVWKYKLRPQLNGLIYQPEVRVTGN